MGRLHEDRHAFLRTEVTGWGIPLPFTTIKGQTLANGPELLRMRIPTVHRLGVGEAVAVGNRWPWVFYYRFCVTSVFTWIVQHRHLLAVLLAWVVVAGGWVKLPRHLSPMWRSTARSHVRKLQVLQSKFLRIATNHLGTWVTGKFTRISGFHSSPTTSEHWLRVSTQS
jgi:Flp pilus assembly pilin Flp